MDVGRKLWHGCIPVCFSIDASEITTLQVPRPYYAMLPRVSLLFTATELVIEHFKDVAPPMLSARTVWFSSRDRPLKWQLPFGVLYDLYADATLPWDITVHFQRYPTELLPCEDMGAVEAHFMNSYKQAMYLLYGSTKWIMNLPQQKHAQLWEAVMKNNYNLYHDVHNELVPRNEPKRHVPLRLVLPTEPMVQLPIPSHREDLVTVADVLAYLVPDLALATHKVLLHGIPVATDVALAEIYASFVYPDGFVYITMTRDLI
ncbi:hypothetical protein SDRG_00731 [Saprolegnia diclina VS20]|uniref:Autophagy protein 5 n=1 Tax=Saprolegnia diclina (strain VS20) TaxID=1156394 RepID=T0R615_SAPDV|nr:hypothetical protein SDRG_00731 [Saprolegnia diclina VS20]EQC41875.1 hypothetical protein SDRG_00731 [Saprolegnia diclina VS20]|eukprot:XP_008604444.1 hypothetical protein SDRG_00731 [Saprolegnia diclina VS20]